MHRLLALALLAAPAALASDLVGPVACRTCHAEAYRIWAQSPHARAADALTGADRQRPLCLQCHSRDEQRDAQVDVAGVSCETCHGGGRYYEPVVVMRDKELSHLFGLVDPTPSSCMVCHGGESPSLHPFDVKEAMGRIDHWTADRAARAKPSARLDRNPLQGAPVPHPSGIVSRRSDMLAVWLKGSR